MLCRASVFVSPPSPASSAGAIMGGGGGGMLEIFCDENKNSLLE